MKDLTRTVLVIVCGFIAILSIVEANMTSNYTFYILAVGMVLMGLGVSLRD